MTPELLGIGEVNPDPSWRMPAHRHVFHELIVIRSGRLRLLADGTAVVGEPGDVLLYRAGCVHAEASDPAAPVNTLFLAFNAGADSLRNVPVQLNDADGRLRQMAGWLHQDQCYGHSSPSQRELMAAMLAELRRLSASPADPMLSISRAFMQRHLSDALTLADVARAAAMSKFAFVRKYKRLSGRTPMHDLRTMRLNQARTMMLTSSLPVKAIAPAVGLGDEFQLSKLFRRHFHLSPREIRIKAHAGSGAHPPASGDSGHTRSIHSGLSLTTDSAASSPKPRSLGTSSAKLTSPGRGKELSRLRGA